MLEVLLLLLLVTGSIESLENIDERKQKWNEELINSYFNSDQLFISTH